MSQLIITERNPQPATMFAEPRIAAAPSDVAVREPSAAAETASHDNRGALLLDLTAQYFDHYVAQTPRNRDTATLWTGHAVARDRDDKGVGQLIWRASPKLLVTSRERGAGKSTELDLITILTRSRNGRMPKVTPSAIAKVLGRRFDTAILDEAKLMFGAGQRSQELQGCLLAGYTPKASYTVSRGGKDDHIPLFGAVAYAGKDELITDTGGMLGDLLDRSITIRLTESARLMPEVDEIAEDDGDLIAEALITWTDMKRGELRAAARQIAIADRQSAAEVPKGQARRMQIWRPLRAVAQVAGGDWPARASAAMQAGSAASLDSALAQLGDRFASLAPAPDADYEDEDEELQ